MSTQIEARRLSGMDLGKTVLIDNLWPMALRDIRHCSDGRVDVSLHAESGRTVEHNLAPTDLVTISGRTTTPTPKETP